MALATVSEYRLGGRRAPLRPTARPARGRNPDHRSPITTQERPAMSHDVARRPQKRKTQNAPVGAKLRTSRSTHGPRPSAISSYPSAKASSDRDGEMPSHL